MAIRIPQNLVKDLRLVEGTEIDLTVIDGTLVIKSRSQKRYSLDELTKGIILENLHTEIDSGIVIGNEFWWHKKIYIFHRLGRYYLSRLYVLGMGAIARQRTLVSKIGKTTAIKSR